MKIAVASGKGGTGKTTLSTNLADFLSKQGRVVLADLDVEEPNSGLFIKARLVDREDQFKMIPEWIADQCTLCGTCQEVCNYNAVVQLGSTIMLYPQLCHGCYACAELCPASALTMVPEKMGELKHFENKSLSFIESKLDIGQEQAVPLIAKTIGYIEDHFPGDIMILFDAPPGTSCPVIEVTKDSDYVILVTEPTPFGLHDLKLSVETMRKLGKKFGVVINRHGIGNDGVIDYCQNEGIKILAKIPNRRKIAELYSQGKLIYPEIPDVKTELENIMMHLKEEVSGI